MEAKDDLKSERDVPELCRKVQANQESRRPMALTVACDLIGVNTSVYYRYVNINFNI